MKPPRAAQKPHQQQRWTWRTCCGLLQSTQTHTVWVVVAELADFVDVRRAQFFSFSSFLIISKFRHVLMKKRNNRSSCARYKNLANLHLESGRDRARENSVCAKNMFNTCRAAVIRCAVLKAFCAHRHSSRLLFSHRTFCPDPDVANSHMYGFYTLLWAINVFCWFFFSFNRF